MENNRHTPIPWYIEGESGNPHEAYIIVGDKQGSTIAWTSNSFDDSSNEEYISEEDTANAQFIIRACNSHDELLEALEELLGMAEDDHHGCDIDSDSSFDCDVPDSREGIVAVRKIFGHEVIRRAKQALAKAKGE